MDKPRTSSLAPIGRYGGYLCLCFYICLRTATAFASSESLQMPGASQSLLLDISKAGNRLVAVGERGHILLSDNNAINWQQAPVPTRALLTSVHFANDMKGWAVGHDGLILATIDAGGHWVVQRDGLKAQNDINHHRLRALQNRQNAVAKALDREIERNNWQRLRNELEELQLDIEDARLTLGDAVNAPPLLDVYFLDSQRGFAAGAFNTLLRTNDGGDHWWAADQALDNPEELHLNAITGDGESSLWIAGEAGLLFHSRDGGDTWEKQDSPYSGSLFGITCSPGCEIVLAFGLRGHVLHSRDAGQTWWNSANGTEQSISGGGYTSPARAILVGSVGNLLVSYDGGVSFIQQAYRKRVNLSAVVSVGDTAIAVGQGGIHRLNIPGPQP
jgi:photosystem II stability/assembly factor-like uncharacterized protein